MSVAGASGSENRLDGSGALQFLTGMASAALLLRELPGTGEDSQRTAALAYAAQHGLAVGWVFRDDGRRPRQGRAAALRQAGTTFGTLIVGSASVLGMTLTEVVALLATMQSRGVRVVILDFDADLSAVMLAAAPIFASTDSKLKREAVARGRVRARAKGVQFGRPRIPPEKVARAGAALANGAGVRAAARAAGISPASVYRLCGATAPRP